jgi:hypothetical protein
VIRKVTYLLCIVVFITYQPLQAGQDGTIQTDQVTLLFDKPLEIAAKDTANIYPKIKSELEKTLKLGVNFRPTVLLTNNRERFLGMAGTRFVVAYAVPQRNLIVIDYSRMNTHPFNLGSILKHELCHLLLHDHIGTENLPKWLDEGISQWVSDGVTELFISRKKSVLNVAVLSKNLYAIEQLSNRFPEGQDSLLLAYAESKSLVDYMSSEFGRNSVLNILVHLKDGHKIDAAILKSLSISLDEFESRWKSHLRKKTTWFTYLADNLYVILFFIGALITVAGFVRLVLRKRRYEDEGH